MKNSKLTVLVSLALLTLSSQAFAKQNCDSEEAFPLISKAEIQQAVASDKKPFVIDVNSLESFNRIHVDGAVHFGTHKKDLAKLLPADKGTLIVAYCGGPQCRAWHKAAREACKMGYTQVKHYKDGISGWEKS